MENNIFEGAKFRDLFITDCEERLKMDYTDYIEVFMFILGMLCGFIFLILDTLGF